MEIWLRGRKKLRIPVLPSEYTVQSSQNNQSVDINTLGEVDLAGKRTLQSISFSSFFPKRYDPSYCSYRNVKSPSSCVKLVEKLKRAGTLRLLITGTPIRLRCRIESFEWSEQDGTGDIYYTLTFKEHRGVSVSTSTVVTLSELEQANASTSDIEGATITGVSDSPRTEPETASGTTYTVKAGDSLSTIARQLTGSADWKAIYEQNKDAIGANPNMITDGMTLTIPSARVDS